MGKNVMGKDSQKNTDRCGGQRMGGGQCKGGGLFMGTALIVVGIAFLLSHMGMLGGYSPWQFWPVLLVFAGIRNLFSCKTGGGLPGGLILLGAGVLLQVHFLGIVHVDWSMIWPVLLIVFGILIFSSTLRQKKVRPTRPASPHFIDSHLVMGGREDEIDSKEFEGGNISCVMGGLELDLRRAQMKGDEAIIDIHMIMGGLELRIPDTWSVVLKGTPILGGFDNKTTTPPDESTKHLIIQGTIVMGGVEVRN